MDVWNLSFGILIRIAPPACDAGGVEPTDEHAFAAAGRPGRGPMQDRLPHTYKGRFPFRLAATSFVYPDTYCRNVERLGPFLDEIELVVFESHRPDCFPSPSEIRGLVRLQTDLDVGFNVHLPIDLQPGAPDHCRRRQAVDTVKALVDLTACLSPTTHTLHLPYAGTRRSADAVRRWQGRVIDSLRQLADSGIAGPSLSLENLDYPMHWLDPVMDRCGTRLCLDIGHLMLQGGDPAAVYRSYRRRIAVIHLHGVAHGRDHVALPSLSAETLQSLQPMLQDFRGTLSLEVFSFAYLRDSLALLERLVQV
jgi:sugar phosphate isomerase/epimerase